jgi:hypothetical protein
MKAGKHVFGHNVSKAGVAWPAAYSADLAII